MAKLTKEARDALADDMFAFPKTRELPLHDDHHVSMAWGVIDHIKCASDEDRGEARGRIKIAAKKFKLDIAEEDEKFSLPKMSLNARSLDIPNEAHPNKMPFSGVLTRIDEPSDAAPEGSDGKRVMLTMAAAKQALDSLLGMAVDYQDDFAGHDPQAKIGVITGATIEANAICIHGFIYAADFPDVAKTIKANKKDLGFSFEARNLMTTDPEADPIPIAECIFTGAAILLKDKAAYRSTSIMAKEAEGVFNMDDKTKTEFAALLADAMKPLSEKIDAQAVTIKKLEDEKVQAANMLSKVEKHASELEKAADHMEAAGIGGHPSRGHAAILRNMAGDLRANAARGVMPAVFDGFYAAADVRTDKVDVEGAVKAAVEKVSAEFTKQIDDVKAAAAKAKAEADEAAKVAETKMADLKAAAEAAAAKKAEGAERKTLSPGHSALLAKAGIELPTDDTKLEIAKLDKAFAEAKLTTEQRFTLKTVLAQAGLVA